MPETDANHGWIDQNSAPTPVRPGPYALGQGADRYVADIAVADALGAAFLRSPRAHAEITKIDVEATRTLPGVVAVVTGADCEAAGFGNFRPLITPFRPVLATGWVRFVGEPVACVVAGTPVAAMDAAEVIVVEYRSVPAVTGLDQARTKAVIHPEAPGNLAFLHQAGDEAAVREAFAHVAMSSRQASTCRAWRPPRWSQAVSLHVTQRQRRRTI